MWATGYAQSKAKVVRKALRQIRRAKSAMPKQPLSSNIGLGAGRFTVRCAKTRPILARGGRFAVRVRPSKLGPNYFEAPLPGSPVAAFFHPLYPKTSTSDRKSGNSAIQVTFFAGPSPGPGPTHWGQVTSSFRDFLPECESGIPFEPFYLSSFD